MTVTLSQYEPPPYSRPTERFSPRADAYRRFRPSYPPALFDTIAAAAPAFPATVVDIGAGTGISALPWLERGCTVFGVEPNAAMRAAGASTLAAWPAFFAIPGTAEATTLPPAVAQIITVAQALHWFRLRETRREMARIAAPGCLLALFWNTRDTLASPFMAAYENLVVDHSPDYRRVHHSHVDVDEIRTLFHGEATNLLFPWSEPLDFESLAGRTRSASYLPNEGPALEALQRDLGALFADHSESSVVTMHYSAGLWLGAAPKAEREGDG